MTRTPPSSSRAVNREPLPVLVFSKEQKTIYTRLIYRVPINLVLRENAGRIDAVRYNGRFWPIYKPKAFPEKSKQWIDKGDTVYGPDHRPLTLPLKHAFLFECDIPRSSYG